MISKNNKGKKIVGFSVIGVVIGSALLDIALIATSHESISSRLTGWSFESPIIPLAFGVLMGHWFWPKKIKENNNDNIKR